MNRKCKIVVCSLLFYLCVAHPSFSANTAEQSKDTAVKAASEQKSDAAKADSEQKKDGGTSASVFFPAPAYEFASAVDGTDVVHDFVIMNKGTDLLKVEKVKTG